MPTKNRAIILVHIAIAMFGSASIFGKLIDQHVFVLVAGRVLFAALITGLYFLFSKTSIKLNSKKDYGIIFLMGFILAIHWIAFYHSIQISTVAIALLTFSTCPIFATFLEPLFFDEKIQKSDIIVAIIAFIGVAIVIPKIDFSDAVFWGVLEGVFSGFTFALVSILERKHVKHYSGLVISFYEQVIVFVILLPLAIFIGVKPMGISQISTFILFSIVFTLFSRLLYISGLKGVSAQTAGVITCLEPLYGAILAALIFSEIPTHRELIGGAIILSAVCYSSIKAMNKNKAKSELPTNM